MNTSALQTEPVNQVPDHKKASEHKLKLVLAGNPNSGKTSIFNMLTGARQKVGNYGGVTVDIRHGTVSYKTGKVGVVDLPGTYSLTAFSLEEQVARDYIVNEKPDAIINVLDSTNLERNLYLTIQLKELGVPMLLVFNMSDEARSKGIHIDTDRLGKLLGAPVVRTVGRTGEGIKDILPAAVALINLESREPAISTMKYQPEIEEELKRLEAHIAKNSLEGPYAARWVAEKLLENDSQVESRFKDLPAGITLLQESARSKEKIKKALDDDTDTLIAEARYGYIKGAVKETVQTDPTDRIALSDKIDKVLTHRLLAFPLFMVFMWTLFQLTFKVGEYPMGWLESAVGWLGNFISANMAEGSLRDLLVDGVIGGVGGVIVFLPNILILFFGISLMEDTGYMARAAFIMDKLMHLMGLHGKSFIPMVMGFGCNVPAIMAARTLESRSDRVLTILLAPLVSCSARLPVYILFAGAFFPNHAGNVIFSMYIIGLALAFLLGKLFRATLFRGEEYPFVMELPPYRLPTMRSVVIHMWEKGKHYLKKMGGVVLVFSVILWFMGAFPKDQAVINSYDAQIRQVQAAAGLTPEAIQEKVSVLETEKNLKLMQRSYIGRLGTAIEPLIAPLGFEWRAGVSLITGFIAKEIVVSSMGVLYNVGEEQDETSEGLMVRLQSAFTPLTAFAFMVFVLLYTPCIVALVTLIREIKSWKYSVFSVGYQLALAWSMAFLIVQGGRMMGLE